MNLKKKVQVIFAIYTLSLMYVKEFNYLDHFKRKHESFKKRLGQCN